MKRILSLMALVAALALALPAPTMAATKKKPDAAASDDKSEGKKKDTYPLYGEVVAITDTLLTIKGGKDKPDRKFDVTKDTKFKKGKDAGTIKDVKVGAWVGGNIKKSADGKGNDTALSINVDVKQKGEAKDAAAKKPEADKKADAPKADAKKDADKPDPKKKKKTDS